mmetsp:Transcript_106535/g.278181  ORF Transcript_106535/g.278181 Transcript_106535/m.278181 type:complete len:267 (-) Transcript_106535:58-858(-)
MPYDDRVEQHVEREKHDGGNQHGHAWSQHQGVPERQQQEEADGRHQPKVPPLLPRLAHALYRGPEHVVQADVGTLLLEAGHAQLLGLVIGLTCGCDEQVEDENVEEYADREKHKRETSTVGSQYLQRRVLVVQVAQKEEAEHCDENVAETPRPAVQNQERLQATQEEKNRDAEDAAQRDQGVDQREQPVPPHLEGPQGVHELEPSGGRHQREHRWPRVQPERVHADGQQDQQQPDRRRVEHVLIVREVRSPEEAEDMQQHVNAVIG